MKSVGIIGGSGFIGSYVTKLFLEHGFDVKVATTDIRREDKYEHLMQLKHTDKLQISEMNVEDKKALQDFVSNCDIVIHSGTPFILDFQDVEKQLFHPTIKGTENFLEGIKVAKGIEKVVFVASVAGWNTNFPFPADGKSFTDTFDETDTRFMSKEGHPYAQAKFMANQVVQQFIAENPNLPFEITTISPTGVMGKSLSNREDSTSGGLQFLIKNKIAPDDFMKMLFENNIPFSLVDVEDVATAIYKAAVIKNLHGKDYLIASETYTISDMHLMLNQQNPLKKGKTVYKNDLAKKELNMDFKPVKQCLHNFK